MLAYAGFAVIFSATLTIISMMAIKLSRIAYKKRLQHNLKKQIAAYSKTPECRAAVRIELPPIDKIQVTEVYVERLQFPFHRAPPLGYEEIPLDDPQTSKKSSKKSSSQQKTSRTTAPPHFSV